MKYYNSCWFYFYLHLFCKLHTHVFFYFKFFVVVGYGLVLIHSFICNDTNIGTAIFLRSFFEMKHGYKLRILIVRPKTKHRHRAQHIRKIRLNCNNWFVFKTFPLLIINLTSCTFYPCNGRSSIELEQHDKKKWALLRILVAHYFQVFNFSIRWYLFSIIDVLLFNILVFL